MRKTCLTLLALGCAVLPVWGQPAAPANDKQLDGYLQRWEEAMKSVKTLAIACSRTETDPVYKSRKTYTGSIHFEKPTRFFLHMEIKDKKTDFERIICTGTFLYHYVPKEKQIKVYKAPQTTAEGKLAQDSSLAFLFGMKATEAKARYHLKLHNVDKNYVYVDVTPKLEVDKADFQTARIVLDKDSFMPRQLWFKHPNAGEVLWDMPNVQSNAALAPGLFAAPKQEQGWQMVQAQAPPKEQPQPEPRLIRQQKP